MIKHPKFPIAVHTWDWKAQPNWEAIQEMLTRLQNETGRKVKIIEVEDTGLAVEYAIVISDESLTENDAKHYYDSHLEWEEGVDPDSFDWDIAKVILKTTLDNVWGLNPSNIYKKQCLALINRFTLGERSSELFDEIDKMSKGFTSSKFLNE